MTDVVLVTCRQQPGLQPDDEPLRAALAARGAEVVTAPWNGPFEPFARAELVVVRSTWDYQQHAEAFVAWLDRLDTIDGVVVNKPSLMRWNARKNYLLDLAARGAPLPPTRLVRPDADAIAAGLDELGLDEGVVKPVFGAGASGLSIVRRDDRAGLVRAAATLGGDGLLQPLLAHVRDTGETSLTFFAGEFSHAVTKTPAAGSILVQAEHGGSTRAVQPSADDVELARSVLALLPSAPLFARVDMLLPATGPRSLMEVEVLEPELFVRFAPGAEQRFAELLLARLA